MRLQLLQSQAAALVCVGLVEELLVTVVFRASRHYRID
jgi:hypothetical protein